MVPSPVNMAGGPKFPNSVPLFFAASFCDMGTDVVLVKDNSFSVDEAWKFFFKAFVYSVQLLTVNFSIYGFVGS
jgi:hypothetical protein